MNRADRAVSSLKEGFNCAQSVLSTYSKLFGLDRELALKIAQAFGGGMARMGHVCGAVTGAFMVIGLKHGKLRAEDDEAKEKTYEIVREFVKRFKSLHGSIMCKDLLGYDLNIPEELKEVEEKQIWDDRCPELVKSGVEILEKLLSRKIS
jgi:C_GCAxxG_C_C family probable redox protein